MKHSSDFQEKITNDITRIRNSQKVFVAADKSRNYYEVDADDYQKLLKENFTATYKKADEFTMNNINQASENFINKGVTLANGFKTSGSPGKVSMPSTQMIAKVFGQIIPTLEIKGRTYPNISLEVVTGLRADIIHGQCL